MFPIKILTLTVIMAPLLVYFDMLNVNSYYSCVFGKRNYRVLVSVSVCVRPCLCVCVCVCVLAR